MGYALFFGFGYGILIIGVLWAFTALAFQVAQWAQGLAQVVHRHCSLAGPQRTFPVLMPGHPGSVRPAPAGQASGRSY
mgnify:CR=1 FL=1